MYRNGSIELPNIRQVLYSEPFGKIVFQFVSLLILSQVPATHQLQYVEPHSKAVHAVSSWHWFRQNSQSPVRLL